VNLKRKQTQKDHKHCYIFL